MSNTSDIRKEEKYVLSNWVRNYLMIYRDFRVVAEDLENMQPGQICDMGGTVANLGSDMERIERSKSKLIEALGDRRDNYEMITRESEEKEGVWEFYVRRVK